MVQFIHFFFVSSACFLYFDEEILLYFKNHKSFHLHCLLKLKIFSDSYVRFSYIWTVTAIYAIKKINLILLI